MHVTEQAILMNLVKKLRKATTTEAKKAFFTEIEDLGHQNVAIIEEIRTELF